MTIQASYPKQPGARRFTINGEPYSVRLEPDFVPTYDEDEQVTIRKGDLRAVLDICTGSLDFGSGFLDNEQVEAMRKAAEILGIDPWQVTPRGFECLYDGHDTATRSLTRQVWLCERCRKPYPDAKW